MAPKKQDNQGKVKSVEKVRVLTAEGWKRRLLKKNLKKSAK